MACLKDLRRHVKHLHRRRRALAFFLYNRNGDCSESADIEHPRAAEMRVLLTWQSLPANTATMQLACTTAGENVTLNRVSPSLQHKAQHEAEHEAV